MTTDTALDMSARYRVDGFAGIAFYLLGWAAAETEPVPWLVCEDEDCEHEEEYCWAAQEEPEVEDSDVWVRAVMVGDDTVHLIDVTDLHKISDQDYCHECGQIGCTADSR